MIDHLLMRRLYSHAMQGRQHCAHASLSAVSKITLYVVCAGKNVHRFYDPERE